MMEVSSNSSRPHTIWLTRSAPIVFVLLWATGFIGAKYGMRDAEPFTFLAYRFWLAALLLLPVILWFLRRRDWSRVEAAHSFVSGCLIHGLYLGGVFYAIDRGMAAGLSSLIVSLQPFFTVLLAAALLGEIISKARLLFFMFAIFGVGLVLLPKQMGVIESGITQQTLIAVLISTLAISLGSVYQKRFVANLNLMVTTGFQFFGAAMMMTLFSIGFETGDIVWTPDVIFSMVWLVLVLSIGAVGLLMFLIRAGSSASVASLFFLVPVVAMVMAWFLFEETLTMVQLVGSAVVVVCVGFASRLKT